MGMSASQARFLCLTARKSNVEFEGQQINQQRTTLSNESAGYYSALCNMTVPVPPSVDDYTKVTYTFDDGAISNTITSLLYSRDGKYHANYTQHWQDDYSIVPRSSALVMKTGDTYSVGGAILRYMDDTHPEWTSDDVFPSFVESDPYYQSLNGDREQIADALNTEKYYVALLKEQGLGEDFYIRYVKNNSTGEYEPVFYSGNQLANASYNDRNLGSVPCYSIGSTTKTKEILNKTCTVEQDSSGRYSSIAFETGTKTRMVTKNNQAEIDAYNAAEPKITDYTTIYRKNNQAEIDEYKATHTEPDINDPKYTATKDTEQELITKFKTSTAHCYDRAINDNNVSCYLHVLSALLQPIEPEEYTPVYVPGIRNIDYTTTTGEIVTLETNQYGGTNNVTLWPVSRAIDFGVEVEVESGSTYTAYLYAGDVTANDESSEIDKLLSDYYLKTGNPTDTQKLISNYYIDDNGEIQNKTLRNKIIDTAYLLVNKYSLGLDYVAVLKPMLESFDSDMRSLHFLLQDDYDTDMQEWIANTTYKEWDEEIVDVGGFAGAHSEWEAGIPSLRTWQEEEEYSVFGNTYQLTVQTVTDEDAYNNAMNDYYYKQHVYEHKIQEINSKLEILQQQDKQLELKLKQLDTEENAISTELDAVKKVLSKNIDSSFKTFNA